MREVPSTEFTRNVGRYREEAQREPIAVSAVEFEELQRHKRMARRSFATVELTEAEIEAIASTRMSPEFDQPGS